MAYIDLGGSGIETHAHLRENGRICLMFCAFEGDPLILRLHGQGEAHQYGSELTLTLRPASRREVPGAYERHFAVRIESQ